MFDRVICLSEHGLSIFSGDHDYIPTYFKTRFDIKIKKYTNPADFLLKLSHDPKMIDKNLNFGRLKQSFEL